MALKDKTIDRNPVDLFPYNIKDLNNFYDRDHPVAISNKSLRYEKYWYDFLTNCIEGKWVYDEGTWVFMPPKLYMYINYAKIPDEDRNIIKPRLRDIEWILFTYLLCVEGFSGFEKDEEYTCHTLVKRLENGEKLDAVQLSKIPDNAKKKDGGYKTYIDAWEYLTNHYLLEEPCEEPLGQPLYDNEKYNGIILSCRGIGKSLSCFVGDFIHEFLTSGIKSIEDIGRINNRLLFAMGSADSRQLDRSISNIKAFYDNQPGYYKPPNDKEKPTYGAFYKRIQGQWETGGEVEHIVKNKDGTTDILGSSIQMVALTKDRKKVGAGDRFRRIYIEEFGFLANAIDVHGANKDSLRIGGTRVGSAIYLGTGGDMEAIREPKKMFENPDAYDVFGIPNFWSNPKKKIGLFIPWYYQNEDYKDPQGNTMLDLAYKRCVKERTELRQELDSKSYEMEVQFNPLTPDEMLRPSNRGYLPRVEAGKQLAKIEGFDLFQKRAMIGRVEYDLSSPTGVRFVKDMEGKLNPILDYGGDEDKLNKNGAFIMYEQPSLTPPEDLYWVLYDPARKSGDGESFHSILVYKGFYVGGERTMYDTIVAEWIGRKERLNDNYELVIKIAKLFNAKIFPEINVAGFVEWCDTNNYYTMLEGDAYRLEKEISPGSKRSYYRVGCNMTPRKKTWSLKKLRDWCVEIKERDPVSGVPTVTTMDWIFSPRILNEIIFYNDDDNFDHISSLLLLMVLINKLEGHEVDLEDNEEEEDEQMTLARIAMQIQEAREKKVKRKKRPKFLQ